jgi:hypothetical protein
LYPCRSNLLSDTTADKTIDAASDAATEAARQLSYTAFPFFPFPSHRVVLETRAGECNLFSKDPTACAAWSAGLHNEPDPHNREAMASVLTHCLDPARGCICIDVGANIGMLTALMASIGCRVTAVEVQPDLVRATRKTAAVNGWTDRVTVNQGFASVQKVEKFEVLFAHATTRKQTRTYTHAQTQTYTYRYT